MPDVVDKRTGKVVQSFGYTEQDRMEADSFASRSENYVVRDKTIRQPVQGHTRYTDSPTPLVPPRIDREGGGMQRYPTVPGGDPVAEMATEGQFQPVSPRTAQLATETGGNSEVNHNPLIDGIGLFVDVRPLVHQSLVNQIHKPQQPVCRL